MKLIIAGSRTLNDPDIIKSFIQFSPLTPITEIVSGHARGIDQCGEKYAEELNIPVKIFLANWDKYGKVAGILRNQEMGEYADGGLLFWDGISKGTKHMGEYLKTLKKPVNIITLTPVIS